MNVITESSPRRPIRWALVFVGGALALFIGLGSTVAFGPSSQRVVNHGQNCQTVNAGGPYDLFDIPHAVAQTRVGRSRLQPLPDASAAADAPGAWWVMTTDATPSGPYDLSDVPDTTVPGTAGHSPFPQPANAP
jgi:hypothetical protein